MPIKIPDSLPALKTLERENIFAMTENRALHQDIRPLKILILNLMPKKIETETQLLRVLSNTPLQVDITLLQMETHESKNTPSEHLVSFYNTFSDISHLYFDGMIVTGAPVELLKFEVVDYWRELKEVLLWSKKHVYSTFHICWGAQAGLYLHYGIEKYTLDGKMFGIFRHEALNLTHPILRGFDEFFYAPHSRHTSIALDDIRDHPQLTLLAVSDEAGAFLIADKNGRSFYMTGHPEYDRDTLKNEYERDVSKGLPIEIPKGYYPDNDTSKTPPHIWRGHANLLYTNWLNHCVYQQTPYDLGDKII